MISMLLIGVFLSFKDLFCSSCSQFIPKIGDALHVDSFF
jgi:hypothetical protein